MAATEVTIYTALTPSQIPAPVPVVVNADIYSIQVVPQNLSIVVAVSMYSPVTFGKKQKYFMRCKNIVNDLWVYWLSDSLDTAGAYSGIPLSDVSDVCLIEVVDL